MNDQLWHVVIRGVAPGVYFGEHAARLAMGNFENAEQWKRLLRDEANALFVEAYMDGKVCRLSAPADIEDFDG
ncbi:hypothetical protein EST38_g13703 [Candolleomyces aberdarensis]|uniref:Uncharacterized protein n=1 Tax=Candolleomyces aberdarensis TaxID=2316362 RepID=A0A4Q2CZA1_9AGAR|nr:hypothetical protein EST38_g13703 [Candolleomyces aberdarensis]